MADEKLPEYRNPETGLLRCPINSFRDCIQARCMFWKNETEVDLMGDHLRKLLPPDVERAEFDQDNCLLLVVSLLAETEFAALGDVWRAISSSLPDEILPPSSPARPASVAPIKRGTVTTGGSEAASTDRPRLSLVDSTVPRRLSNVETKIEEILSKLDLLLKNSAKP